MRLDCPYCGRTIAPEDINIQRVVAKCSGCGGVFGFADKVPESQPPWSGKVPVDMPKGFSVDRSAGDFKLVRRWFSPLFIGLLFFCAFWDGFLVVWYTIFLTQKGPLLMGVVPLIHVAVGFGLSYYVVAGFVNRTVITVSVDALRVKHEPLPWPGNRSIARMDLAQLFCREQVGNKGSRTYEVHAVLAGEKRVKLVSGLLSPEQALFIEQQIENQLGLKDRPVQGEMR
ncbi:MAG: hypothetical protein WC728_08310 [Elusimicrobiota bacterium]